MRDFVSVILSRGILSKGAFVDTGYFDMGDFVMEVFEQIPL